MFSNRSNPPLCQVSMFNTSPISRKCDITVRTCKLLRHIIPLEEIDRNCLQLSYALFFGLIHISLTFSERDVGTALSYRDKNHFGASISRKTNFKSSIWKWQRRHFRKLLEVARFSLRDVTMAKIVRTNKLPSSSPPAEWRPCVFVSNQGGWWTLNIVFEVNWDKLAEKMISPFECASVASKLMQWYSLLCCYLQ